MTYCSAVSNPTDFNSTATTRLYGFRCCCRTPTLPANIQNQYPLSRGRSGNNVELHAAARAPLTGEPFFDIDDIYYRFSNCSGDITT